MDVGEHLNNDLVNKWMPYWRPEFEDIAALVDKPVRTYSRNHFGAYERKAELLGEWEPTIVDSNGKTLQAKFMPVKKEHNSFAYYCASMNKLISLTLHRKMFKGKTSDTLFVPHSFDGKPSVFSSDLEGCNMHYHKYGEYHRENDLPAYCHILRGKYVFEWVVDGKWHRPAELGPALICLHPDHGVSFSWYENHKFIKEKTAPLYRKLF